MSKRTKAPKCSSCEDALEQDLSTYCHDPVYINAYVDYTEQHFKTIQPTGSLHKNEQECHQAKQRYNETMKEQCANGYSVATKGTDGSHLISGYAAPTYPPTPYCGFPPSAFLPSRRSYRGFGETSCGFKRVDVSQVSAPIVGIPFGLVQPIRSIYAGLVAMEMNQ